MTLTPVVTEQHVDEAIRLFDHSTMDAVQSGMSMLSLALQTPKKRDGLTDNTFVVLVDGLSRSKFSDDVAKIEDQIRRRMMLGSRVSVKQLRTELENMVCVLRYWCF